MHSNGVKTHHPAKILHMVAIFSACIVRNPSLSTAGSHFKHPVAILKPRRSAVFYHRKAKIKIPLKCIETHSMHSNGVKTHHPAKILHTAAIFSACIARNLSLNTVGSHFKHLVAILKPPISCLKKHHFAKNWFLKQGTDHRKAKKKSI